MWKKILLSLIVLGIIGAGGAYAFLLSIQKDLPKIISMEDYEPLLVSQVYDRKNQKIGEYVRQRRILTPYDKIPEKLVQAFVAAEDHEFFEHSGINLQAIFRAFIANIRAGRTVQGGSTITQQVAKTLMLTSERTIVRKLKDMLLAIEMEKNLSKAEIMYLYLNQIFLGNSAYGVGMASEIYYRKPLEKLTLPEMAMLAGLPTAPSAYSPVRSPKKAKERQVYVLTRMHDVGYITEEEMREAIDAPVTVYLRENYEEFAPHFLETVRLMLISKLGESTVLDKGLRIFTSLDLDKQQAAQKSVEEGLKELDKRQGYRGAKKNLATVAQYEEHLEEVKKNIIDDLTPERVILADGTYAPVTEPSKDNSRLPAFLKLNDNVEGIVTAVDDELGLVYVKIPDAEGVIDIDTMNWARKPDTEKRYDFDLLKKPSGALRVGDVILVKVTGEQFASERLDKLVKADIDSRKKGTKKNPDKGKALALPDLIQYLALELDQVPVVEGALISFDQKTQEVLAMVGGYKFIHTQNEFNRTLQAARQTGSAFKAIVYASALDKGYTPATPIMDAPLVFEEQVEDEEGQEDVKVWKPANHSKNFGGDIILRNALVQSLNVPTVKIIEDIGVPWAAEYAKRLGIFSTLNMDFTLALGSSSVTLYEMTKVFGEFGRLGKRLRPLIITRVEDRFGKVILTDLSLDLRFEKEMAPIEEHFSEKREKYLAARQSGKADGNSQNGDESKTEGEVTGGDDAASGEGGLNGDRTAELAKLDPKKRKMEDFIFHEDPDQLIRPQTAYVMTSMLKGVVEDGMGTGGRARALGRETAGKTGSTNGYFDGWFIGYTPQISTGVWVGYDREASLGKGEVGGKAALPIWVDYMKFAHEGLPQMTFPIPEGIVFANVDRETGKIATATSNKVVRLAFIEGTEPSLASDSHEENNDFLKQDLNE